MSLSARHYRDHPLRNLTDDELRALIGLGEHTGLFHGTLATHVADLADLASQEESDRMLRAELDARR